MQARGGGQNNSQHRGGASPANRSNAMATVRTIAQMQEALDEHKEQMPEGVYLQLSNLARDLYRQVTAAGPQPAPWSVQEEGSGRFTYMLTVPATVSVTTDVDLREVYDYGIGGTGHRHFWYRGSEDDEYHELPMHLESVESEPEVDQGTWLSMHDNAEGIVFDGGFVQMTYGEHNLSADLRHELGYGEEEC
jgi:hypothetical protein